MASLELKIPPPVIALLTASAMWAVARWGALPGPLAAMAPDGRLKVAALVAFVGLCFDVAGIVAFWRAKTTVNPMKPENSVALVSSGVYRITRNPMYVGMGFILLAWAVYLGSTWGLLGPLVFVAYITRFQIKPEERALAARFGAAFASYQSRVRRWL
ncbi:MAG: protein-S-isoprenylcysteine methyltransferase [Polaromonas sp. 28-63-22]|nr:MAG: protein-S-isoprenylcysteine methyltransferase [Polaromonas sp. 28-63-22]